MIRPRPVRGVLLGVVIATIAHAQQAPDPRPTGSEPESASFAEAFNAGDYAQAQVLLLAELDAKPNDPLLTYNLACTRAVQGQTDLAAQTLIDAIGYGFVDFHHMQRDPNLRSIREHPDYLLVLKGWGELLDARGEAQLASAQQALGPSYTFERDSTTRLNFASAMAPDSFARAKEEIEHTWDWFEANLFPDEWRGDQDARPDPWVLIMLPTQRDFFRLGGAPGLGGFYDKDRKHLISQDIGPTLRHEFFHVLHWRHMDSLGQEHPYWMMEGLASLLEDVDLDPDGEYILAPSWRTNIAKRLERAGRLLPLERLFAMDREHFMASRSRANYAQARAFGMFLFDGGALRDWYAAYIESYSNDSTGKLATARVSEHPLTTTEREYRLWLRALPEVAEQLRPAKASLGVALGVGSGDGPDVTGFVRRSRKQFPDGDKLRKRDVITAIDDRSTPTLDDLHRVLADYEVGQIVTLSVRRGQLSLNIRVRLKSRSPDGT